MEEGTWTLRAIGRKDQIRCQCGGGRRFHIQRIRNQKGSRFLNSIIGIGKILDQCLIHQSITISNLEFHTQIKYKSIIWIKSRHLQMCTILIYLLPLSLLSGSYWYTAPWMKEVIKKEEDVGPWKAGIPQKRHKRGFRAKKVTAALQSDGSLLGSCGINFATYV